VKGDKDWTPSRRQRAQAIRLGVELTDADTVHSAAQKLNVALVAREDKRADLERRTVELLEKIDELERSGWDMPIVAAECARALLAEWKEVSRG